MAFLDDELNEEVYINNLKGPRKEQKVRKLLKCYVVQSKHWNNSMIGMVE